MDTLQDIFEQARRLPPYLVAEDANRSSAATFFRAARTARREFVTSDARG
jgi:hypothetical protein